MADDWSAEVATWMGETSVCLACADELVRDPGVPGSWLSRDGVHGRGVCRARDGYAGGAPHRISAEEVPVA